MTSIDSDIIKYRLNDVINFNSPLPTNLSDSERERPEYYGHPVKIKAVKKAKILKPKKMLDKVSCRIADAMLDYSRRCL